MTSSLESKEHDGILNPFLLRISLLLLALVRRNDSTGHRERDGHRDWRKCAKRGRRRKAKAPRKSSGRVFRPGGTDARLVAAGRPVDRFPLRRCLTVSGQPAWGGGANDSRFLPAG